MALLTDSDQVTTEDMLAIDPEVSQVASIENVTLEGVGSVTRQAWGGCAAELLSVTQSFGNGGWSFPGGLTTSGQRFRLNQIVASDFYSSTRSPLQRWMTLCALRDFYRACVRRRSNDRYEAKLESLERDIAQAWRLLSVIGIGVVGNPLSAPGAIHNSEYSGALTTGSVTEVSGSAEAGHTYDVAVTWTAAEYVSAASKQNAESGPSEIGSITVTASHKISVDIPTLVAPTSATRAATGWNVYVGLAGAALYLQNATPTAVGTTAYTLASTPVLSGYRMDQGQVSDVIEKFQSVWLRG